MTFDSCQGEGEVSEIERSFTELAAPRRPAYTDSNRRWAGASGSKKRTVSDCSAHPRSGSPLVPCCTSAGGAPFWRFGPRFKVPYSASLATQQLSVSTEPLVGRLIVMKYAIKGERMTKITLALCAILVSGCAAKVLSSSPRTVVVNAGSLQVAEAQVLADAECKKHSRFAKLSGKATPNQFVFDCVN